MSAVRDLTGFVPIPGLPGYLVHPDGRVVSLKKDIPMVLSVSDRARPHLATVRLNNVDIRIRDLLHVMFGRYARWDRS